MRGTRTPLPVIVAACAAGVLANTLALGTASRASAGTIAPTYHVAPRAVVDARLGFDATQRPAAVRPILIKANRGDFLFGISHLQAWGDRDTRVPEPAMLSMLGFGLLGLGFFARRRRV